jgi:Chalcone isomerase-like
MAAFLRCVLLAGIAFANLAVAADELLQNGTGVRKRVFFEVYSISLYLPKRTSSAEEAISSPGLKRVDIRMLRDVSAEQFSGALADGIRANHSEAQARALEPSVKQLTAIMAEVQEAKKGMVISLGWSGKATQVRVDGKAIGAPIEGEDFYRALLRIWLGDKPVQDDLKKGLLGQPG